MIWPFRRPLRNAGAVLRGSSDSATDGGYVSRPRIEKAIRDAWAQGGNLVIYGPSHQGKTTLLARQLAGTDAIHIECRPDFKRTQIYRVALSALGYAVMVEKKKRGKASTTVKFGLLSAGVEASAEGEVEQTMQSVTIDLKNPSEVAHLISRIQNPPRLVLNNFQLLDRGTKKNLLFDLTFFAERPGIRTVIVGTWTNEYCLEEIEPAVTGKFRYVQVPTWSDAELRSAAAQWSLRSRALPAVAPRLDECLSLAGGDISLFRALVEGSRDHDEAAPDGAASPAEEPPIEALVLGRFRRGLNTKLKAIFAERDIYLTYLALRATRLFVNNPQFHPIPDLPESEYLRTTIDPTTNRPYSDGRQMRLDGEGHPQYMEATTGEVVVMQTEIASFLLRQFHGAVQQGGKRMGLAALMQAFIDPLDPKPIAVNAARLKEIFVRFDDVQRQALIVPPMLSVDAVGDAMEIADRRLFLFLGNERPEDLEELLEDVAPRAVPSVRRRNQISPAMTDEDKEAYIEKGMPEPPPAPRADDPVEEEPPATGVAEERDS